MLKIEAVEEVFWQYLQRVELICLFVRSPDDVIFCIFLSLILFRVLEEGGVTGEEKAGSG